MDKEIKRKEKVTKALKEKKIIDDTSFTVFQMVEDLREDVEETINKLVDDFQQEHSSDAKAEKIAIKLATKLAALEKGDTGDEPSDERITSLIEPLIPQPIKGDSYILTLKDKQDIASSIIVPIVEKEVKTIIEKTEVLRDPIVTENVVEKAMYEEPTVIAQKLNTLKEVIEPDVIKGFRELERLTKLNAFNPTMGPSFADIQSLRSAITTLQNAGTSGIILTTTGTSGAATLIGNTLNIPQYSSGGATPGTPVNSVQFNNPLGTFAGDAAFSYTTGNGLALNNVFTQSAVARTSGSTSYFTINAPADTGITANTESIGINIVGSTRTWADGTVATQREYLFQAPTYNKTTTAATFTNTGTLVVTGPPIAGTGVTMTHNWPLWVQSGVAHFGSQIGYTQIATGGTGIEVNDSNNNTGGHVVTAQNTNAGTSAYCGVNLGNNQSVDGAATSHYFGIFFNGSNYNDATFGTANNIPSLGAIQNTDGPVSLQTYAAGAAQYINFVTGSSATNEQARISPLGLSIGTQANAVSRLTIGGNFTGAAWGQATSAAVLGPGIQQVAATYTDNTTAAGATVSFTAINTYGQATLVASNATSGSKVTYSTIYANYFRAPIVGTNTLNTFLNSAGFENSIGVGGNLYLALNATDAFINRPTGGVLGLNAAETRATGFISSSNGAQNFAFISSNTTANANARIITTGYGNVTTGSVLWGTATSTQARQYFNAGNDVTALLANTTYAGTVFGSGGVTEATSGTHQWIANVAVLGLGTITNGSATTTNTASLYVGAVTTAIGTNNYALYVDTGNNYFGGKTVGYNGIATTGWGMPAIYGYARPAAGQTGAVTLSTYTVGAADGTFLVSANILVTTSTLHNFTVTVSYTDEGNTARVLTLQFSNLSGTLLTAIANAAGAVPYEGVPLHIRCKASTSITIATAAGGTYTTVVYNGEGFIEQWA